MDVLEPVSNDAELAETHCGVGARHVAGKEPTSARGELVRAIALQGASADLKALLVLSAELETERPMAVEPRPPGR